MSSWAVRCVLPADVIAERGIVIPTEPQRRIVIPTEPQRRNVIPREPQRQRNLRLSAGPTSRRTGRNGFVSLVVAQRWPTIRIPRSLGLASHASVEAERL